MAQYLRMGGWGTTTLVSSGKDVYIHYAAPEFAFAFGNDERSKAAVLYCEPGGYYELDAEFTKPVVACVVGRWKSKLTRAVGHAGAMSGGGDDAASKERWFMQKFGVDGPFTPENPVCSAKGAVVTNIADIPAALTAVMAANGVKPDFAPEGTMELKVWFGSNAGAKIPSELDLPTVRAVAPYDAQVKSLELQVGATFAREALKDASGVSQMDAKTQVTRLNGVSVLDAAQYTLEGNVGLALLKEPGGENDRMLVSVAVGAYLNLHGEATLAAAQAAREAGNAPNAVLAAALAIVGPRRTEPARADRARADRALLGGGPEGRTRRKLHPWRAVGEPSGWYGENHARPARPGDARRTARPRCALGVRALSRAPGGLPHRRRRAGRHHHHAGLGPPDAQARFAPDRGMPACVDAAVRHVDRCLGRRVTARADALLRHLRGRSAGCPLAHRGRLRRAPACPAAPGGLVRVPDAGGPVAVERPRHDLRPGGQGGSVVRRAGAARTRAAQQGDDRFSHPLRLRARGQRLRRRGFPAGAVQGQRPDRSGQPSARRGCQRLAARYVESYARYKADKKTSGNLDIQKIPGVNHPVFKDKPINHDPREVFIAELMARRGEHNVFHEFYRALVQKLYDEGVSRNVYCVNIDAVIAALLLKTVWPAYRAGTIKADALETAAFTIFLYARMLGCAAEIDDHLNRGRNMDTRSAASACRFLA
ncbi:hypothetical protein LP415_27115 [Polaromonas sp. P1(28)-8]|nr:hypothetical protein LP415_27115 [Polaromonas sp. P1(28)-8]